MGQEVNADWLREEVVKLFTRASASGEPDHSACASYASLLFRLLPRGDKDQKGLTDADLEQIRRVLDEERKVAVAKGEKESAGT